MTKSEEQQDKESKRGEAPSAKGPYFRDQVDISGTGASLRDQVPILGTGSIFQGPGPYRRRRGKG